jgi:hypothetical protein
MLWALYLLPFLTGKKTHAVGSLSLALFTGKNNLMLWALYLLRF